jgi:hypothetical protein
MVDIGSGEDKLTWRDDLGLKVRRPIEDASLMLTFKNVSSNHHVCRGLPYYGMV